MSVLLMCLHWLLWVILWILITLFLVHCFNCLLSLCSQLMIYGIFLMIYWAFHLHLFWMLQQFWPTENQLTWVTTWLLLILCVYCCTCQLMTCIPCIDGIDIKWWCIVRNFCSVEFNISNVLNYFKVRFPYLSQIIKNFIIPVQLSDD